MNKEKLRRALTLGNISQVGCVVRDLSKTIRNYEEIIGIGPFTTLDFRPKKIFIRGRKPDMDLKIAVAQLTPELSLELIEVLSGEPCHKDFLEKHGEGVQHLGFMTDEYDQVLKRAEALGIEVLFSAESEVSSMGHVRAAYLDTYDLVGVIFEILEIKPF
jgi:catechol 2,3-dioxygenase-like lactoylglutathione lyase family enzyme